MALQAKVTDEELSTLKGKTIIITGGASGIGRAATNLAHAAGANVTVADISEDAGAAVVGELKERIHFIKTDVSSWPDVLNLFTKTYDHFGAIDVVLSNAGTNIGETLLDDELDENGHLAAPTLKNLEVNLHGSAYCARAAVHFFKKQPEKKCQLIFTASAAAIVDTPPLFLYCAGKAGVVGLMRGMRQGMQSDKITVNVVAPWMTVTPMLPGWIRDNWGNLPANTPEGVATALLLPAVRTEVHGKTLWVGGNDVVEIEDGLYETRPKWLGSEMSRCLDQGQKAMGIGA